MDGTQSEADATDYRALAVLTLPQPATARRCFVLDRCSGFRRDAFHLLERSDLNDLFAPELGQIDGTAAHALERLFALIAEAENGVVITMDSLGAVDASLTIDALRSLARERMDEPKPVPSSASAPCALGTFGPGIAAPLIVHFQQVSRRALRSSTHN